MRAAIEAVGTGIKVHASLHSDLFAVTDVKQVIIIDEVDCVLIDNLLC